MNKHTTLRSLNSVKAFYLGQLEGQFLRSFAKMNGCAAREDDVINALNHFDFSKKLFSNYDVIAKNSTNAQFIADYLCAINWMSFIYSDMARPSAKMQEILKRFFIEDEVAYFEECWDYYAFAYDYLYRKFMNDRTISDAVKSEVYRINN